MNGKVIVVTSDPITGSLGALDGFLFILMQMILQPVEPFPFGT